MTAALLTTGWGLAAIGWYLAWFLLKDARAWEGRAKAALTEARRAVCTAEKANAALEGALGLAGCARYQLCIQDDCTKRVDPIRPSFAETERQ